MATLYELTNEYQELLEALENTSEDPRVIEDTIASTGINDQLESKFDGYGKIISQLKADAEGVDAEIKRLTEKKRAYKNNSQRLKVALLNSMAATNTTKVKTPLFSFSVRNTRVVDVSNADALPEQYTIKQPVKPDKKAIKAAIESGEKVPGATIGFNESLTVR